MNYSLLFAMKTLLVTVTSSNNKEVKMLAFQPTVIDSSRPKSVLCYRKNLLQSMFYLIKVTVFHPFKTKDAVSYVFANSLSEQELQVIL